MKLPLSSLQFRPGMAENPLGRIFFIATSMAEKATKAPKMRPLGWYQLVLVLKGEGHYRDTQGREIRLCRGNLIITPPDLPHQCAPPKGSTWSILTISFHGPLFDLLHQNGQLKCLDSDLVLSPVSRWYEIFFTLCQLTKADREQPLCYLSRFLAILGKIPFNKQLSSQDGRPAWITTAISRIESADPAQPLPAKQIAIECKTSYSTFRQLFSRYTGYGPSEYHNNLRIKTASELIAYGNKSFKQIALQLGYYDEFHFSKHFKDKTGLSPRQFKAELITRNIKVIDSERVQKMALQEWFKSEEEKRLLEEKMAAERRRNWRLVFQEAFEDKNVRSRWAIQGEWACKDGELCVRSKGGSVVTLNTPIPGDVRLVFDCHLESQNLSDVSCFLCALKPSEKTHAVRTGYSFQYGAFQNRRNILANPAGLLWNQPAAPLVRGKICHVDAQKLGNRLILKVDDKTIIDVRDHSSVFGKEHAFLGFHSWGTEAYYSNVQVYMRDSAMQADLLETADDFLSRGDYSTAKGLFEEVISSSQDVQRTELAQRGLRKALQRIALAAEFPSIQKRLLKTWPKAILTLDSRGISVNIRASGIEDLSPLQGLPVSELNCDNNRITSLQPLQGMEKLETLSCHKNQIQSLAPLQGLVLVSLTCSDNQISCLDPLRGMELRNLNCSKNRISSIEPLRGMKLDALWFACNKIVDIDPLRGMGLLHLSFPNNQVMSLEPLRGVLLHSLNCSWNQIQDLGPLQEMGLAQIRCNGNRITSLAPLQGMPLRELRCAWNQIKTLDPLQEMTLDILSCHDNPIKSLQPLLEHLPKGLYFSIDKLDVAEQQLIRSRVENPGFAELLRNAEILLQLKQKNYDQIKSLALPCGKHRYLMIPREVTWLEAKKISEELGGHLAVIRNWKENDFLRSQLIEGAYNCIGLYSDGKKMTWVTGENHRFQNIDSKTFVPGHSFTLVSSGIWSGNTPWMEDDGFCVEWDE